MKKSFIFNKHPMLTCMIQEDNIDDCVADVKNAIYDGTDAFGFQICQLNPIYRTQESYEYIFSCMANKPIYITNYRGGFNCGVSDDDLISELLKALKYGADMADIMGDTYEKSEYELAKSSAAIEKQKKLIDQIHCMGKEVLISSHIHKFLPAETVLEIAYEHQRRGADVVKIVTGADSEEEEIENLRITSLLKRELDVPFLFLSNGTHNKIHRIVGPMIGCSMCLCVQSHNKKSTKTQPLLRTMHDILYRTDYAY